LKAIQKHYRAFGKYGVGRVSANLFLKQSPDDDDYVARQWAGVCHLAT
jgi:hypothetical protein